MFLRKVPGIQHYAARAHAATARRIRRKWTVVCYSCLVRELVSRHVRQRTKPVCLLGWEEDGEVDSKTPKLGTATLVKHSAHGSEAADVVTTS
ncbi:hypothetical protein E4U54_006366, partial [Claviceps lovelessii]